MSVHTIKMPDIGEGIAEVELVEWHVAVGDTVAEDQVLADVMTDKASVEVPSPVAGTVLALGGDVGQMMAVGSELIRIEVADATSSARTPPGPAAAAAAVTPAVAPAPPAPAQPVKGRAAPGPARAAQHTANAAGAPLVRAIASPAVRARAWELGIDINALRPSGTAGRVVHADA